MKSIRILAWLLVCTGMAQAQNNNVQSAADWLKQYNDLPKAKNYIDMAAEHPSTANDPKMWYYRGKIYWAIYRDTTKSVDDPDAIYKSTDGFLNCLATDTKQNWTKECTDMAWVVGSALFNSAVVAYNKNDLARAEKFYTRVLDVFPHDKDNLMNRNNNITPDLVRKQLFLVANKAKDFPKAKSHLQALIDKKYNDPQIYASMSRIYLNEDKDTAKALAYIEQGRGIFSDNTQLFNMEMNIYVWQNRHDILIAKISEQLENDPEEKTLYYKRGFLYQMIGDVARSSADYKKAIELDEDYFDANHGLGTLLFNEGFKLSKAAGDMKAADYDKAKIAFDGKFRECIPYLEKAVDLNPQKTEEDKRLYKDDLTCLKGAYARTGQNDKYEQVKAKLEKP